METGNQREGLEGTKKQAWTFMDRKGPEEKGDSSNRQAEKDGQRGTSDHE